MHAQRDQEPLRASGGIDAGGIDAASLLEVEGLVTVFDTPAGPVTALDGVSFRIGSAEIVGIVGESGSGKTLTALSVLRLLDHPGRIAAGSIRFDGADLLAMSEQQMRRVRGARIAMIWQDPMASLNPVRTIGDQIAEALTLHARPRPGRRARAQAVLRALDAAHVPDAPRRAREYPHQLSGGLQQRVMIAMALVSHPALLIADEPTTALDVTIQLQILELLRELRRAASTSIMLITHDLGVVAETCDQVQVMYCGRIVESAPTRALFRAPAHPYTANLLASMPRRTTRRGALRPIRGAVPELARRPAGCPFHPRCEQAVEACSRTPPPRVEVGAGHLVECHLHAPGA